MEEVESMQIKIKKLEAVVVDLMASTDGFAERAEVACDTTHMVLSNSLKKTAKAEAEELGSIKTKIENKLKTCPELQNFI